MAINVGPQPSQGIGGIPTRYVIIGAGVLGVGALLLMQQRKPAAVDPNSGDVQPTGSVSAQLSSVQQLQLQQYGEVTKMFAAQGDAFGSQIGGLSTHMDSNAAALSSFLATQFGQLNKGQTDASAAAQAAAQAQYGLTQSAWSNIMHGIYQTFMRASNPSWMPGGQDDPWRDGGENSTQDTVTRTAA